MGLGGKMFNAGFAQGATAPILEQQKTDLALLQDKLRAIATTERALAVQTMQGQQAAERTIFQQQQMNLREQLSQIGQSQRAQQARRASVEDDAAEAGVSFIDFKDNSTLLNQISQINGNIRAAETSAEAMDALAQRNKWALELTERTGINVPPEAFDNPELMRVITRQAAAEARRREAMANSPDLDATFVNGIMEMGAPGAAIVDQMVAGWEREGMTVDATTMAKAMMAKWSALSPENQMKGYALGSGIINSRIDNIINGVFLDGLPSAMELSMLEGGQEMYKLVQDRVSEMLADPAFSVEVKRLSNFTINQIMGSAPLTFEDYGAIQSEMRQLGTEADQRAGANQATTALAYPAQEQQRTLQFTAESLVKEMLPEVQATGNPAGLEQLAVMYEERAIKARDEGGIPGEDYLTPEDYTQIAEWIREQVAIMFPPNNPADPFARPGAGIFTPGGQQDLNNIGR